VDKQRNPCPFCGSAQFEEREIEYLYSLHGKYLFVPNMPVFVCLNCGEVYYPATRLLEVERRFKAIYERAEQPDRYENMPVVELERS